MKSPKVVCLGVHLLDVLVQPSRGPKPTVGWELLDDLRITAAGTAAGPAVDLAKLGAESISIGVLGDDFEGNVVADLMAEHGCDVSRMVRAEGAKTHISLLFIDENGERNPVMIRPTTARPLTMADIDLDAVASADVLHATDSLDPCHPVSNLLNVLSTEIRLNRTSTKLRWLDSGWNPYPRRQEPSSPESLSPSVDIPDCKGTMNLAFHSSSHSSTNIGSDEISSA